MRPQNLSLQIQAMSIMVEVEAMKAENKRREIEGEAQAYDEIMFQIKSQELLTLSQCVDYSA